MQTKNAITYTEIILGALLDVKGAFDKTSFAAITEIAT
jgi:hypothetical protein